MNTDYLIIDLEATCDNGGLVPRDEMEIIEIGGVLVDHETLEPIDEFASFVRPVRRRTLTPFCVELTSITQAQVDAAPRFPAVMRELADFVARHGYPLFCSWGGYDQKQLRQDARYHRVAAPLGPRHLNLKQAFSERLGTRKRFGMEAALRRVGVELLGTHHRGIDDARNIARLLPWCLGRRAFPARPRREEPTSGARRRGRSRPRARGDRSA
ncbi:MAG: exonuclease domain-containing protein [Myxococcales bacterium]|nr:exonuclease domain-containing protein [Myxococcales bacterium]